MTTDQELVLLRAEATGLRKKIATVSRAWKSQQRKNDDLEQKLSDAEQEIERLKQENQSLQERLQTLESQKQKLSGMIFKSNRKKSDGEQKHRGAQLGHKGHGRKNPKRVDLEKDVFLTHCPDCGNSVSQTNATYERIVEDIPIPQTIVTKYHIQRQWCPCCQREVSGVPQGTLPGVRFGTNLLSLMLMQRYQMRTPLAKIVELLNIQYRMDISQGGIQGILHSLKNQFGDRYNRIVKKIKKSPIKHADETSWRIDGINGWCWGFFTQKAALYTIEETRGKGVPTKILQGSSPESILVRDDYGAYQKLPLRQQSCWAHLLRVSHEAVERDTVSSEMLNLHEELKTMFSELSRIIEEPFHESTRRAAYDRYLKVITEIQGRTYQPKDAKAIQERIRNQGGNLITALLVDGVPLTNNHAERNLRPMVVTRKISGGSRSNQGASIHAVNMSVLQTIRLQGKNLWSELQKLLTVPAHRYSLGNGE